MSGLSTNGSISFGDALVTGRKRVPRPAAGNTALRILCGILALGPQRELILGDLSFTSASQFCEPKIFGLAAQLNAEFSQIKPLENLDRYGTLISPKDHRTIEFISWLRVQQFGNEKGF